jgi:hypothetical protein
MHHALASISASPEISQFANPVVIVISDGEPSDESSTIAQITKFEAEDIPLIGLGIGRETKEMASLFKNAVVDMNVASVASTLCNAVRNALYPNLTPAGPHSHLRAA